MSTYIAWLPDILPRVNVPSIEEQDKCTTWDEWSAAMNVAWCEDTYTTLIGPHLDFTTGDYVYIVVDEEMKVLLWADPSSPDGTARRALYLRQQIFEGEFPGSMSMPKCVGHADPTEGELLEFNFESKEDAYRRFKDLGDSQAMYPAEVAEARRFTATLR